MGELAGKEYEEFEDAESADVPEGFVQDPSITRIEHFLKGSGIVVRGNKLVSGDSLAYQFEKQGIPDSLFALTDESDANKKRAQLGEMEGVWAPFDMEVADLEIILGSWSPTIKLEEGRDGKIPSEWEFSLTNTGDSKKGEKRVNPNDIIPKLPIRKGFEDIFSLQRAEKPNKDGELTPYVKLVINQNRIVTPQK